MVTVIFFFAIPFNIGSPFFKKKNSLFPGGSDGKGSHCNVEDPGIKPGSRRSPGKGHDYPLQYSCMENSMDRGAWGGYSPLGGKESDMTDRKSVV